MHIARLMIEIIIIAIKFKTGKAGAFTSVCTCKMENKNNNTDVFSPPKLSFKSIKVDEQHLI